MAHAPLNLTPAWLAWQLAGLSCLLLDEEAAGLIHQAGAVVRARPPLAARLPEPAEAMEPAGPARPAKPANVANAARAARSETSAAGRIAEPDADPAAWPKPWRDLLARMQPAPLAWTYPELGEDLLLGGGKERGAALREMISRLRLPRGSSTFWPARLPGSEALAEDGRAGGSADYFRAGLKRLEVRVLIVFGSDGLSGTAYGALPLKPFSEHLSDGRLILTLPGFSSLLSLPDRLDKVVFFLNSVLSCYLRA